MTVTKLRPTFTFDQERLDALRAIAPEAFADGQINWDVLKEALGEHLEEEGPAAEHFGLTWPGKRAARRLASQPSAGTLLPATGEGVNEDRTLNIFIEGDNLEVLKLLQKSYAGRVKMIYIDPPYNTGNDFVYRDDYSQPLEEYLRATGQADEVGRILTTNTKAGGRFHSNWLDMMYPRLRLARQLLSEEGVLFVSIDDNEVYNLRLVMHEVFGEENFIATIMWQKMYSGKADATHFGRFHEYILCYANNSEASTIYLLPRTEEMNSRYSNPDDDSRGLWLSNDLTASGERSGGHFPIVSPSGKVFDSPPGKHWLYAQKTMLRLLEERRIWFGKEGNSFPRLKRFLSDVQQGRRVNTVWLHSEVGHTDEATKEIKSIFPESEQVFETPKPTRLIARILQIATSKEDDDIVLDFFAGSCTTAQAVLELNREDGGNRRFIMVQLPEPTPPESQARSAGFSTIAEIGKERIRRVIKRMQGEQQKLIPDRETPEDLGFRVLKLGRSHFKAWQDYTGGDVAELETLFDRFESPLAEGWTPESLLVEVMLLQGFPLDSTVTPLAGYPHNHVLRVTSDLVAHQLYVCLDERLYPATADTLALGAEDVFVCLDSALDEETKLRLQDGRNVVVI